MARENERKRRWSKYIAAKLDELNVSAADLARATDLTDATVSNWKVARAGISAEAALLVAAALRLDPSEVLREAGFPLLADAFEGKELRLVGTPALQPDPVLMKILADKDLDDEGKAVMIRWWGERLAEDEARRIRDAEVLFKARRDSA
jgi:transcriptional regulator with XRE-family HTH domain